MKSKTPHNIFFLFLIAMITMSCLSLPKFGKKTAENGENQNGKNTSESGGMDEDEQTSKSDETDVIVYDEGGFKFKSIPGWETSCMIGIMQMKAPDATDEAGPAVLLMAGDNETEMTTDEAFEKFKEGSSATKVSNPKKVKVGGFPALQAELTSDTDGVEVRAVVITSMLTAKRQFTMIAMAPADKWNKEAAPYIADVRDSIKFIDIDPTAGCPEGTIAEEVVVPEPEVMMDPPSGPEPEAPTMSGGELRQWAVSARASSEYGNPQWSAMQAVGEPDVEDCEDSSDAWASLQSNTKEWIELSYETPVYPTEITIHMNYNPSQVVEVQIITVDGKAYTVTEAEPEVVPYCPDAYAITLDLTKQILVDKVKIFIDQSELGIGWNEIDAVELVGTPEGGVAPSTKPSGGSSGSSNGLEPPYTPEDLDPGTWSFAVSGYENTVDMSSRLQYQSIDVEYVVGLISKDERYVTSLMLPKKGLKQGVIPMKPYDSSITPAGPTAVIYINAFLYVSDEGEFNFTKDPSTGKLTGTFYFKAHSKDFPDREIEVAGSLNQVPLK
jgi:hypothetical protein